MDDACVQMNGIQSSNGSFTSCDFAVNFGTLMGYATAQDLCRNYLFTDSLYEEPPYLGPLVKLEHINPVYMIHEYSMIHQLIKYIFVDLKVIVALLLASSLLAKFGIGVSAGFDWYLLLVRWTETSSIGWALFDYHLDDGHSILSGG